jgi:hypothetical protein
MCKSLNELREIITKKYNDSDNLYKERYQYLFEIINNLTIWDNILLLSTNDKYFPQTKEKQNERFILIINCLLNFCDDYTITNINFKNKINELFITINNKIDENSDFNYMVPSYNNIYIVIGSSRNNTSISDNLVLLLEKYVDKNNIITFGQSQCNNKNHYQCNLLNNTNNFCELFNFVLLSKKNENKNIVIYFTLGFHNPKNNIISVNNFVEVCQNNDCFNCLKKTNKISIIVTGTDAILPSTSLTFYKMPNLNKERIIHVGYNITKLYQIVKLFNLICIKDSDAFKNSLGMISSLNNMIQFAEDEDIIQFNTINIINYDNICNAILTEINNNNKNFNWVKNLSVILTSMHEERFFDANEHLDKCIMMVTNNVIFRAKNLVTKVQAAFEHLDISKPSYGYCKSVVNN